MSRQNETGASSSRVQERSKDVASQDGRKDIENDVLQVRKSVSDANEVPGACPPIRRATTFRLP